MTRLLTLPSSPNAPGSTWAPAFAWEVAVGAIPAPYPTCVAVPATMYQVSNVPQITLAAA